MKLSNTQIQKMVELIIGELKSQSIIVFKEKEPVVYQRAVAVVKTNIDQEKQLDLEVNQMMDELENQHPGEFQRYKMFPMLKKKLAKQKGFIL